VNIMDEKIQGIDIAPHQNDFINTNPGGEVHPLAPLTPTPPVQPEQSTITVEVCGEVSEVVHE